MSSGRVPEDVKSFLRSVLLSTNGVNEHNVERDYRALSGEKLNWRKYGFVTLHEFLSAIPDVCCLEYKAKEKANFVYAVKKEGVYISSHAQKNAKTASSNNNSTVVEKNTAAITTGRKVREEGESLKITIDDVKVDTDGLKPNANGLYQVYVTKLPMDCTERELKKVFSVYGEVIQCDVIISSAKKKVGFVRYFHKQEASRALNESKVRAPKVRGCSVEVGLPKKKKPKGASGDDNRTTNQISHSPPSSPSVCSNSAPPTPSLSPPSTSSSPPKAPPMALPPPTTLTPPAASLPPAAASLPPPKPQPLAPQWKSPSEVQPVTSIPTQPSTVPKNVTMSVASTTSTTVIPPSNHGSRLRKSAIAVHVSGYNNQITKDKLEHLFKVYGNIVNFDYNSSHSIIHYHKHIEAKEAVNGISGKFIDGCVLLVKVIDQPRLKFDPVPRTTQTVQQQTHETGDSYLNVYDLYQRVVTQMCGTSFKHWLHILPSQNLDIRFMEIVDPLTYWVHIYDKERDHQFTDLTKRLQCIKPGQGQAIGKNEFGAGRYTYDEKWYRCYCFDVSRDQRKVHVIYIDYGNTEWLDLDRVVVLPKVFLQLHPQGVLVKISGFTLKLNENDFLDEETVTGAMELFLPNIKLFASKTNFDSNKPLILNIDLYSDTVKQKLCSLPGIEAVVKTPERVLLTPPLLAPEGMFEPFKECLADLRQCVVIWIVHITSPTTFYFQLANASTRSIIFQLINSLSGCSIENKVNVRSIGDGDLVCYHGDGLERSRVCLTKIGRSSIPGHVDVLHVDIGKTAIVPCDSFIALPGSLQDVPYQARPAKLFKVSERDVSLSEVHDIVNREYRGQVLRANIIDEEPNGTVIVELFDRHGYSLNMRLLNIIEHNNAITTQQAPGPTTALVPQEEAALREQKPAHADQDASGAHVQQSYDVRLQSEHDRANSPTPPGAQCDAPRVSGQDERAKSQELRVPTRNPQDLRVKSMTQSQEARVQSQDARVQSQDARVQSQDARVQLQDIRAKPMTQSQDVRVQSQDMRARPMTQSQDMRAESQDMRAKPMTQSQDVRAQSRDMRAKPMTQSQDVRAQSQDVRARPQVSRPQSQMSTASQDVRQKFPDTRSQTQEVRALPQTRYAQPTDPRESASLEQNLRPQNLRPLIQPSNSSMTQNPVAATPIRGPFDEISVSATHAASRGMEVVGQPRRGSDDPQVMQAGLVATKTYGHSAFVLTEEETKMKLYPDKGRSTNEEKAIIRPGVFTIDGSNAVPRSTNMATDHNSTERMTTNVDGDLELSSLLPSPENVPTRKTVGGFGIPTTQPAFGFGKEDGHIHGGHKMTDHTTSSRSNTNLGFSKTDFGQNPSGSKSKPQSVQSDFTIDDGASSMHGRQQVTDHTTASRSNTGKAQSVQSGIPKSDSTNRCKVIDNERERSPLRHEDVKELQEKIAAQEKILSKPESDQKTLIVQQHIKEKLELQVSICSLENEIFVLKNNLKELTAQKTTLQRQVSN